MAWTTRVVFLMIGVGIAVWAPLVPDAKARLGLAAWRTVGERRRKQGQGSALDPLGPEAPDPLAEGA